jgi:adenine-specific DNA-methyltransferase
MLVFQESQPQKSINTSFYNESLTEDEMKRVRILISNLIKKKKHTTLLKQDEEHHKGNLKDFLCELFYNNSKYKVNNKSYHGRMGSDLVIYNGKDSDTTKVIIEVKIPGSNDMITKNGFFKKSLCEAILYYLWEREKLGNTEITNILITDMKNVFVFNSKEFHSIFYSNIEIKKYFKDWNKQGTDSDKTDQVYKWINNHLPTLNETIKYNFFNLESLVENHNEFIDFYKTLHPINLIKEPFKNDSNSLNKNFYNELLYIIGLEETHLTGKTIITRMKKPIRGTLIESVISKIESESLLENLIGIERFGDNNKEQLFNVSLELCITWVNRVLFLKLLESKLLSYDEKEEYKFLNIGKISSYDELNTLFFNVLNEPFHTRDEEIKLKYKSIPYLNSSLFETSELERKTLRISGLPSGDKIPVYPKTKVIDDSGNIIKEKSINTFEYFLLFLNTYNFGIVGKDKIVKYKKDLINSSVLGLIFEKINGYKEGSFYTPGFVTNYMSKDLIENTVIDKFNNQYNWDCKSINELQTNLNYSKVKEYGDLFDTLKVCDTSVGSGHFLVSCLNQLLRVKSELNLIITKEGKSLNNYFITIDNDEIYIKNLDEELFYYRVGVNGIPSAEMQKVQETIFNEKKKIIEKSLFGVDINSNSVKICRLRLWIELLKHSYFTENSQYRNLKTLPNIDINIKEGNSLIHRFPLEEDIKEVLKNSGVNLKGYLEKIHQYKETDDKKIKKEIEKQVETIKKNIVKELDKELRKKSIKLRDEVSKLEIKLSTLKLMGFEITEDEEFKLKTKRNKSKILLVKIEQILSTENYKNSFEWRVEFPEVLDHEGKFLGFDIIIGNPPYIKEKDGKLLFDPVRKCNNWKERLQGKMDYWFFFLHLGFDLMKDKGRLSYITNSYWIKSSGSSKLIERIKNELTITQIVDFNNFKVFEEVEGKHMIHTYLKDFNVNYITKIGEVKEDFDKEKFNLHVVEKNYPTLFTEDNKIDFQKGSTIKYSNCDLLGDVFEVSTGIQESTDRITKKNLEGIKPIPGINIGDGVFVLSKKELKNLNLSSKEKKDLMKKYLVPENVGRYHIKDGGDMIIFSDKSTHSLDISKGTYPNIKKHLDKYKKFITSSNKPYGLHRPRLEKIKDESGKYIKKDIFQEEKLICYGMFDKPGFTYDNDKYYVGFSFSIIYKKNEDYSLKYLLSILNSDFGKNWFYKVGKI